MSKGPLSPLPEPRAVGPARLIFVAIPGDVNRHRHGITKGIGISDALPPLDLPEPEWEEWHRMMR